MLTAWRDKLTVLRAPPALPLNGLAQAGRQQQAVKRAFLAYLQQQTPSAAARAARRGLIPLPVRAAEGTETEGEEEEGTAPSLDDSLLT